MAAGKSRGLSEFYFRCQEDIKYHFKESNTVTNSSFTLCLGLRTQKISCPQHVNGLHVEGRIQVQWLIASVGPQPLAQPTPPACSLPGGPPGACRYARQLPSAPLTTSAAAFQGSLARLPPRPARCRPFVPGAASDFGRPRCFMLIPGTRVCPAARPPSCGETPFGGILSQSALRLPSRGASAPRMCASSSAERMWPAPRWRPGSLSGF